MRRVFAVLVCGYVAGLGLLSILLLASPTVEAQGEECGGATMAIEGGTPAQFVLPANRDGTLRVEPGGRLRIAADDPVGAAGRREARIRVSGLGLSFEITAGLGTGIAPQPVDVDLEDELPSYVRGLYKVDGTLVRDGVDICTVGFKVRVGGFGGPVATGAAIATGLAGAAAVASAPLAAGGLNANLKAKVQLRRRRPTGWRRYLPVPAWKKTILSTLLGAITGLCAVVLLQQAGATTLSPVAAILGLVAGGGVTVGIGYSLGAVWTFVRPPVDGEDGP